MAVAGRKCVRFYAYVVQHADDEVGQRRVLSLVVCDVASVLVVAAHQTDWQVSGVVGVCVSLVAAEQIRCVVKSRGRAFVAGLQACQQVVEAAQDLLFNLLQLCDLGFVSTPARQVVVFKFDSVDIRDDLMVLNDDADYSG